MQMDIGQGWKIRPGVFDGAISISTIQWLCVASKKHYNPFKRCCKFFQSLY
jgi:18S rRNA (guanine1575-N7)-methyltransferase